MYSDKIKCSAIFENKANDKLVKIMVPLSESESVSVNKTIPELFIGFLWVAVWLQAFYQLSSISSRIKKQMVIQFNETVLVNMTQSTAYNVALGIHILGLAAFVIAGIKFFDTALGDKTTVKNFSKDLLEIASERYGKIYYSPIHNKIFIDEKVALKATRLNFIKLLTQT